MLNRRQFAHAAAAVGATLLNRSATVRAQDHDLILRGGRVIDPSLRINAVRDVAVAGGRIAAVEPRIEADAEQVIDASGKLVLPGLLDVHSHYAQDEEGPWFCLSDG